MTTPTIDDVATVSGDSLYVERRPDGTLITRRQPSDPTTTWWLQYNDHLTAAYLGTVIIEGFNWLEALGNVNILRLNPGGQVSGRPLPPLGAEQIPSQFKNRLLHMEDALDLQEYLLKL